MQSSPSKGTSRDSKPKFAPTDVPAGCGGCDGVLCGKDLPHEAKVFVSFNLKTVVVMLLLHHPF